MIRQTRRGNSESAAKKNLRSRRSVCSPPRADQVQIYCTISVALVVCTSVPEVPVTVIV
jgi:hypothetical protein